MKYIFSCKGKGWESMLDPHFGRAEGFFLFDDETKKTKWISNEENENAAQGAGKLAAQLVINTGASVLITGHVGPKAFDVLSVSAMKIFISKEDSLEKVFEAYQQGKLEEQTQ